MMNCRANPSVASRRCYGKVPNGPKEKMLNKIKVLSVASLLGEAIKRIHEEESISVLFK